MNKSRISRTTSKQHPQLSIRRADFAIDPRVAYVESVCATLIESRFGPDFIFESSLTGHSQPSEILSPVLYDLDEIVPNELLSHLSFLGRIAQIDRLRSDKFSGTQDPTGSGFSTGRVLPGQKPSVNERSLQFWDARSQLSGNAFLGRGSRRTIQHQRCDVIQTAAVAAGTDRSIIKPQRGGVKRYLKIRQGRTCLRG